MDLNKTVNYDDDDDYLTPTITTYTAIDIRNYCSIANY